MIRRGRKTFRVEVRSNYIHVCMCVRVCIFFQNNHFYLDPQGSLGLIFHEHKGQENIFYPLMTGALGYEILCQGQYCVTCYCFSNHTIYLLCQMCAANATRFVHEDPVTG